MATKKTTKKASAKREYVIVRTTGAGVHCGYLAARKGDEVTLTDARRIWCWNTRDDAKKTYTLSDLALTGWTGSKGRVAAAIPRNVILGAHEVMTCTAGAAKALIAVAAWQ
jgi:hypothetical protein